MAAKIDTEDLVTCPICFEQFTNPKCLPCLHTFCYPCIKSYIITHLGGEGKKAKKFPCPVCRQDVTVTDMDITSGKIVDSMPGNHLITSLIDKISDKSQDGKQCGPCNFRNKETAAVSWCKYCNEALCENCAYHHEGLRQSNHDIIPLVNIEKEKSVEFIDVDEPCVKHAGKILEVYCVDHKEMCCVICLATSHRKCEHISTFEEMATESKDEEFVEWFADCLLEIENKTDELEVKMDENMTNLNRKHDEISQQVTTTVQQAKDKLDHLHSSFMTNLQHVHKQHSLRHSETKERIESFKQTVKNGLKLLKAVQENGSPKQVFITKEKLKVQLKQQMEGLKVDLKDVNCIEYELNIANMVSSLLNTLSSVAEVDMKPTLDLSTGLHEVSYLVDCLNKDEQPKDILKLEVTKERTINPGGEITGVTFLQDERIVLCCSTKKKLQCFDKSGNYLFHIEYKNENPIDVCLVFENGIVVSFYNQAHLIKYKVQELTYKEIGKIPCRPKAWGVAATKDNIIVGYESEIDILSMSGQVVRTFSRKGDWVSCVAVSLNGNVYYNDGENVVCKTLDGREVRRFTNPSMKRLLGIVVDKYENVYVCGCESSNVCAFSSDGRNSKILLSKILSPLNLAFDSTETKFCVATSKEGCHFYSLKYIK